MASYADHAHLDAATGQVVTSEVNLSGVLLVANNLSDVVAATARTNLGLGTAATHAETDFLQAANNLSDVASSEISRFNIKSLGVLSTTTGIDGKALASTTIYTVPGGKTAVFTGCIVRLTTVLGLITGATTVSVNNSTTATTVLSSVSLATLSTTNLVVLMAPPTAAITAYSNGVAGDVIQFVIAGSPYNAATATLSVDLLGYLL